MGPDLNAFNGKGLKGGWEKKKKGDGKGIDPGGNKGKGKGKGYQANLNAASATGSWCICRALPDAFYAERSITLEIARKGTVAPRLPEL